MSEDAIDILARHLATALEAIRTLEYRARVSEQHARAADERIRELQAAVMELSGDGQKRQPLEITWPSGARTQISVQPSSARNVDTRELASRIAERARERRRRVA